MMLLEEQAISDTDAYSNGYQCGLDARDAACPYAPGRFAELWYEGFAEGKNDQFATGDQLTSD